MIDLTTYLVLGLLAGLAGFVDAVVGGGGLIQIPALLIALPNHPLPTLFGTSKLAGFSGTAVAAWQYAKRIRFHLPLLLLVSAVALAAAYAGALAVSRVNMQVAKLFVLVLLIAIAIYTFLKKDLGASRSREVSIQKRYLMGGLLALFIGFYDGIFGPGTGSFLVLGFVVMLGFDFLTASAYAKCINALTNFSALLVFVRQGNYVWQLAAVMAVCNVAGNLVGSRMALRKGNGFVRQIFLTIVCVMIARYAWDLWQLYKA